MKFETKYDVNDKVWLRTENIESYIKEHPYEEPRRILKACFSEGYVNNIKVETDIFTKKPSKRLIKRDCRDLLWEYAFVFDEKTKKFEMLKINLD